MATIIINEEKKGAQEMLNLLGTLDFVTSSSSIPSIRICNPNVLNIWIYNPCLTIHIEHYKCSRDVTCYVSTRLA